MWLFTPTYAARGLSELLLDEAVYLYRLISETPSAEVAELGRFRGGTTYFMAAAGARVLSVDNDASEESRKRRGMARPMYRSALEQALATSGLDDRVELVTADALAFTVPEAAFDLVYLDLPLDAADMASVFERWWTGLRPGGRLVLRDGREPSMPGPQAFAATLPGNGFTVATGAPGRFVVVLKS